MVLRDASGHPCTMREIEARKQMVEMAAKSKVGSCGGGVILIFS